MTTPSFDVVQYDPVVYSKATRENRCELEDSLPKWIKDRLVQRQTQTATFVYGISDDCIYVESADKEVQQALDELLHIHTRRDYSKRRYVEVPKAEIDRFLFTTSACVPTKRSGESSQSSSGRRARRGNTVPLGLRANLARAASPQGTLVAGLRTDRRCMGDSVDLLVSAEVKRLFDENEVTGLVYEPCEIGTKKRRDDSFGTVAYVARIQPHTYLSADEVSLDNYCPEHQVLGSHRSFNQRLPYSRLGSEDFHAIDHIRVGEQEYQLQTPGLGRVIARGQAASAGEGQRA